MKRARLGMLLASTAGVLLPLGAQAQQIEEIMVTAQKRSESLREVPQAISVLTAEQLDRLGVKELADIAAYVPGVAVRGGAVGQRTIVMRGIASNTVSGGDSRMVGIYVDDVPFGSATPFTGSANIDLDISMFDLDRVEVLPGPQGTLYGASSMGGVLKYVTKAPKLNAFEAKTEASFGFINNGGTDEGYRAVVNAPVIADKVAVRVQGYHQDFGGYINNIAPTVNRKEVGGVEQYGGRAQILLQPTDNFSVKLAVMGQDLRRDGSNVIQWDYRNNRPLNGDLDNLTQNNATLGHTVQRFRLYSLTGDYDFGWAKLTAVAAQQNSSVQDVTDQTATLQAVAGQLGITTPITRGAVVYEPKIQKNTGEIRLASPTRGAIDWIGGFYYANEKTHQSQIIAAFNGGTQLPIDFGHVNLLARYRELAAFVNGTYHITDRWDVTAGLRGSRGDEQYRQPTTGLLIGNVAGNPISSRSYVASYAASTKYKFSDLGMVYARFATGYRPGGPNVVAQFGQAVLNPDKTKNYEVGAKIEPVKWMSVDLSVYHVEWTNMQMSVYVNGVSVRGNANSAESNGSELTVRARPLNGLLLSGTLSYTDAHLNSAVGTGTNNLTGPSDPLPGTPKWAASLNADYEFPVVQDWTGLVGASWNYVGERNSTFLGYVPSQSSPNFVTPSYNQVNLRAGISNDRYAVQFFVRNVGDERGIASGENLATRGSIYQSNVRFIQPRTIGVTLDAQF